MATCPIRCYGCNKVLGNKYHTYWARRDDLFAEYLATMGPRAAEAQARLEASSSLVTRNCCKKMLRDAVDMTPLLMKRQEVKLRNSEFKARRKGVTTIILGRGMEQAKISQSDEMPEFFARREASSAAKGDTGLELAMGDVAIEDP